MNDGNHYARLFNEQVAKIQSDARESLEKENKELRRRLDSIKTSVKLTP